MALYGSNEYQSTKRSDLEMIKANILTKIHDEYKYDNVACLMEI